MSPIRVDFYLLASPSVDARWHFACRLLEKAYFAGNSVFVFCQCQEDAETLDELLWTFKEDSFIPHNLQHEGLTPPPPIQIGHHQEPRGFSDVLLNLNPSIPPFYSNFKRVIELVSNETERKELGRKNYRFYRDNRCELFTHNIC